MGREEFRQELLVQAKVRVGPNHFGSERRESAEERARRLIGEALKEYGFCSEKLELLPGGSGIKVELARRLRRETTMSLKWIARELGIGSWKYLSNLLSTPSKPPDDSDQPQLGL